MFDINATINNAIADAVAAQVKDLKDTYAGIVVTLSNRIDALEEENMRLRMNHDKLVERVSEARIKLDAVDAVITAQAQPKVGLTTQQVKDIVMSVWLEDLETATQDIAKCAIQDHDFDDAIRHALREYDFTSDVEAVLDDYDMSNRIEEGIDDYDFSDKLERACKECLEEVLNNATISIRV